MSYYRDYIRKNYFLGLITGCKNTYRKFTIDISEGQNKQSDKFDEVFWKIIKSQIKTSKITR